MIKLVSANLCCQVVNQINCIREQGLEEVRQKTGKELVGVVGIQGKKVRRYLNPQKTRSQGSELCLRLPHIRDKRARTFPLVAEEGTRNTDPVSTTQDTAASSTSANLYIYIYSQPSSCIEEPMRSGGSLRPPSPSSR